jgi:hypothetical protein
MADIKLNIYAEDGKTIEKTYIAKDYNVPFGVVRKLMKLMEIEKLESTSEIVKIIVNAWDKFEVVLNGFFPDVTEEEWDKVPLEEISTLIIDIAINIVAKVSEIPTDSNQKKMAQKLT